MSRMAQAGFNTTAKLPVVDTLWMLWPTASSIAEKMSRLWLHEVARFSCFEKVSYPWILSQVPEFKARLTDAIYIYSPQQRICPGDNTSGGVAKSGPRKSKRRLGHRRGRRMTTGHAARGGEASDGEPGVYRHKDRPHAETSNVNGKLF